MSSNINKNVPIFERITERELYSQLKREKFLGQGAYGTVYEASVIKTGEARALKMINKTGDPASDQENYALAQKEASCWAPLKHVNIVRLFNSYELPNAWCYSMEVLRGGDLLQMILEDGRFGESIAQTIVSQVARGLRYMHSMGVLHRDMKMENLMLANKGDPIIVKLCDFGLSCFADDPDRLVNAVGTPGYVSPEVLYVAMGYRAEIGPPCDIWGLGVITYILLSGHPPFTMDDDDQCVKDTLNGNWSFPSQAFSKVSNTAKDLVRKMLVIDQKKRIKDDQVIVHPWIKDMPEIQDQVDQEGLERLKKFNAKMEWKKVTNLITATAATAQGAGPKHQADVRQRHSDMGGVPTTAQATMQQVQQAQQQQQKMALTATVKDASFAVAPGTERIAPAPAAAAGTAGAAAAAAGPAKRRASDIGINAASMERAVLETREEFIRQEEESIRRANEMTEYINSFSIGSSLFKCDLFMGEERNGNGAAGAGGEEADDDRKKKKKRSLKDRVLGRFKGSKDKKEDLSIIPTKSGIVMPPPKSVVNASGGGKQGDDDDDNDIFTIAGMQGFALSSK